MLLKSFTVKNFRSIKEVTLDNLGNLNLISAINGVGKSSLQKAFELLNFDKTDGTLKELVNWNSDFFEIHAIIEHNGNSLDNYLKYELSGKTGKSTRRLIINGSSEETYNNSDAIKKLTELFNPLLHSIMLTKQKESSFLTASATTRRDTLKKVWNLDFQKEAKLLEEEAKEVGAVLQQNKIKLNLLAEKTYSFGEPKEFPFSLPDLQEKTNTVNLLEKSISEIDLDIRQNQDLVNKREKLATEKSSLLEKHTQNLSQEKSIKDTLLVLNESIEKTKLQIVNAEDSRKKEILDGESALRDKIGILEIKRLRPLDRSNLEEINSQKTELVLKKRNLEQTVKDCQSGKCPTCKKEFNGHDISSYQSEIRGLDEKIAELATLYAEKESLYKVEVEAHQINENNKQERIRLSSEWDRRKAVLEQGLEIAKLQGTLALQEQQLTTALKDSSRIFEEIETSLTKINILNKEIEMLPVEVGTNSLVLRRNDLANLLSSLRLEITNYQSVESYNSGVEATNQAILMQKQKDEKEVVSLRKEIDRLELEISQIQKLRSVLLKDFPSFVISEAIASLQSTMNAFIEKVYYKPLNVSIVENGDAIDVLYGTGKRQVDASLASGCESSLLDLSYRVALSEIFHNDFLWLDEYDSAAYEATAVFLAEIVANMSTDFSQIFVITHVEEAKEKFLTSGANLVELQPS